MIQLAVSTFGVVFLFVSLNLFEKKNKRSGLFFGIIGLSIIIFAGNLAALLSP